MDGKKGAIIRIAVLAITTINAILTASGRNPIPFDESAFTECLAYIINGVCAVWAWYKNNNMTKEAIEGSALTKALKAKNNRNKRYKVSTSQKNPS